MSSNELKGVFNFLIKPVREALLKRGFTTPTEPQEKAIPLILEGKNVLLISPTASGKTEAAILPVFNMMYGMQVSGIKTLYITPLRALNRDLLERLEWWCRELGFRIAVRHGDTEQYERIAQAKMPPDILITTPETLQIILAGKILRKGLIPLKWVIVDEVHELAEDKRGVQLSIALERLRKLIGHDFQVIGLSATIGSPETVGRFLVGVDRSIEIVKISIAKLMKLNVVFPEPAYEDFNLAAKLYIHPDVAARLRFIRNLIENYNSVLLFVNTRAIAEVLASRFKVWDIDFPISVHHGSLSKPSRVAAERGLKNGELKGLVCTSSLELGIDVGRIDLVIQYMSPRQVTRLIQRVGRAGHGIGRVSNGIIVTADADDALEAMVICRAALNEELEPIKVPDKPLDVLCHQIVSLLMYKRKWKFNEFLEIFRNAYPYANLNKDDLILILNYMYNRYPRLTWVSYEDEVILAPKNSRSIYEYFFENLSMIPDEKKYLVINIEDNTPIGFLDEVFVSEYGDPSRKFVFRGSLWKIKEVIGDRIYVAPDNDPTGAIPSWVGEEIPVPYAIAQEVGRVRSYVASKISSNMSFDDILLELKKIYPIEYDSLKRALISVYEQVKRGLPVPSDVIVTLEKWGELIILTTHLGLLANRALSRVLGDALSSFLGHSVEIQEDPYRVVVKASEDIRLEDVVEILRKLSESNIKSLSIKLAERSGLFKYRLIHVARRFGALSKHVDVANIGLHRLVELFKGSAIYEEALKEYLSMDVDVDGVQLFLRELFSGKKELKYFEVEEPSPISRIGLEKISMRGEIIPPERLRKVLIEATKARLLNEVRYFVCVENWDWWKLIRIHDLNDEVKCEVCDSKLIALLDVDESIVKSIVEKRGSKLTSSEKRVLEEALGNAKLIAKYGKLAAIVLVGRGLNADVAQSILLSFSEVSDAFYEKIMEAERRSLRRGF
ncbi:MAG: DEAD/DEAH box helicase [Candidatus Methanomethylicia archaeon]|nr:DEAD/DEAH box helicase [Candidatus Methanomethylicia archaeon]